MTRQVLLSMIRDQNTRQKRQTLRLMGGVAMFTAAGLLMLSRGQAALGLAGLLFFGVTGGAMILLRLTAPAPSYGGGRLEARPVLWARLLLVLVALASVAGVVAFVISASGLRQVEMVALGVAWGVVLALGIGTFLRPGPVITVDAQGYFDRRASRAPIPWERIDRLDVSGVRDQIFYRLRMEEDDGLKLLARMNRWVGAPGIAISCGGLDVSDGDVVLAVHAWRPALLDNLLHGPFD